MNRHYTVKAEGHAALHEPAPAQVGETIYTTCGQGRITYHPEWDASSPWVSYWQGTAGRHFERPDQAAAYFKERRKATLDTRTRSQ